MKVLSVVLLFLAAACTAAGQVTKPHVAEPMKALNFMVGKWQGEVRYEPGFNQPQEIYWTAHVHYNIGGSILIIDEKGSEIENRNNTTGDVLVVVYWDSAANDYPGRLYWSAKDGAGSVELKGYVQNNSLVLKTNENDAVNHRFSVRLNDKGQWYEVGEISDDGGKSRKRRFEMTLTQQD